MGSLGARISRPGAPEFRLKSFKKSPVFYNFEQLMSGGTFQVGVLSQVSPVSPVGLLWLNPHQPPQKLMFAAIAVQKHCKY